jgi:hypothetical protein
MRATYAVHLIWLDLIIPKFIGKYELLSPHNLQLLYASEDQIFSSQTSLVYEEHHLLGYNSV